MKALIVEDDFVSRVLMQKLLGAYGDAHVAIDGQEAVEVFIGAFKSGEPYDLVSLDILLPKLGGQEVLKKIRAFEQEQKVADGEEVKVIIVSALGDQKNISEAESSHCESYLVKPINKEHLLNQLKIFELISEEDLKALP